MRKQRGSPNAAKSVSTDHPQGNLRIRRQVRQQQVAAGSANPASPERGGARSAGGGVHAQNSRSEASPHPSPRSCEMSAQKEQHFAVPGDKLRWGSGGARSEAEPPPAAAGSARPSIRKEPCGFAEFGNSNLWFPNSSIEPAAASGSGHCPAASGCFDHRGDVGVEGLFRTVGKADGDVRAASLAAGRGDHTLAEARVAHPVAG